MIIKNIGDRFFIANLNCVTSDIEASSKALASEINHTVTRKKDVEFEDFTTPFASKDYPQRALIDGGPRSSHDGDKNFINLGTHLALAGTPVNR